MSSENSASEISRRKLLAGAGAAVGATVGAGALGLAPASAVPGLGSAVSLQLAPAIATPGLHYRIFSGSDFDALTGTAPHIDESTHSVFAGTALRAYFSLPAGSRIVEVEGFGDFTGAGTIIVTLYRLPVAANVTAINPTSGPPAGRPITATGVGYFNALNTYDATVGSEESFVVEATSTSSAARLRAIRVGYVPLTRAFVPINPVRVYDSRFDGLGKLPFNLTRTLSVANQIVQQGSAINVVPVGAAAIAYNLTLANTEGSFGYLSVYPQNLIDSAELYGSAINWNGVGVSIANGLNVAISPTRQIKVTCGGVPAARTDFLVDVTGYYI